VDRPVGVRVANPTQYSLLLLLLCWMLIGCVVLGCVEFRALKREVVLCATGFLHPSIKKKFAHHCPEWAAVPRSECTAS
jgi:hypothetical protein